MGGMVVVMVAGDGGIHERQQHEGGGGGVAKGNHGPGENKSEHGLIGTELLIVHILAVAFRAACVLITCFSAMEMIYGLLMSSFRP